MCPKEAQSSEPDRVRETVGLAAALQRAVADLGIRGKLEEQRALLAWNVVIEDVIGAGLAEGTEARSIQRGELVVSVNQDALRHRLLFERDTLRERINGHVGAEVVRSIRFSR